MADGMTNGKRPDQNTVAAINEKGRPDLDSRFPLLLIVIGFGFFCAAVITFLLGGAFGSQGSSRLDSFVLHALFLVGLAVVNFVSYTRFVDRFADGIVQKAVRWIIAVATVAIVAVGLLDEGGIHFTLVLDGIVWLLFGIACGLLAVSWGTMWSALDSERPDNHATSLAVGGSVVLAAVFGTFMVFAPGAVSTVAIGAMVVASLMLQIFSAHQFPEPERIDWRTSQKRFKLFSRNMIIPAVVGFALGISLVLAIDQMPADSVLWLCLAGIAGGGVVAAGVLVAAQRVPRFSSVERVVFPVLAAGFLALPYTSGTVRVIVIVLLIADATTYLAFHWSVLIALSYRHHVQTAFHFAQGLISPLGGLAVGWIAAGTTLVVANASSFDAMLGLSLAAVLFIIVALAIVPFASNREVEAVFAEDEPAEGEQQESRASWRLCCKEICDQYQLTPREQEVFALLAKGRNAEHIGKELFISMHTVKTHTSRIYRKLSINSQQELIDCIEDRRAR